MRNKDARSSTTVNEAPGRIRLEHSQVTLDRYADLLREKGLWRTSRNRLLSYLNYFNYYSINLNLEDERKVPSLTYGFSPGASGSARVSPGQITTVTSLLNQLQA